MRTPKYAIGERPMKLENKQYRRAQRLAALHGNRRSARTSWAWWCSRSPTYNFLSIPFLSLFVFGYYWAGFTTLYQEHQSRLQWLQARNLELARQA